jgi:hypothetical protein
MNRHDRSSFPRGVNQYEVASLLAILDKSGALSARMTFRAVRGGSLAMKSSGNSYPPLKGSALFGNRLTVGRQTLQV